MSRREDLRQGSSLGPGAFPREGLHPDLSAPAQRAAGSACLVLKANRGTHHSLWPQPPASLTQAAAKAPQQASILPALLQTEDFPPGSPRKLVKTCVSFCPSSAQRPPGSHRLGVKPQVLATALRTRPHGLCDLLSHRWPPRHAAELRRPARACWTMPGTHPPQALCSLCSFCRLCPQEAVAHCLGCFRLPSEVLPHRPFQIANHSLESAE